MLDKSILWILFASLFFRLLLFAVIASKNQDKFLQPDSYGYLQIAENIVSHEVYSGSHLQPLLPEHTRTPVYPFFISIFKFVHMGHKSIIFFQILLSVLTVFAVTAAAYKFSGNNLKSAYLAGILMATDIPTIVLSNSILTETLFTVLLFASIILFVFYLDGTFPRCLIYSAFFMGLSVLCRPIAFLLPGILVVAIISKKSFAVKKRVFDVILFLFMFFLVLSPWLVRNKVIFGSAFLSTISYDNLLYYQAAAVVARENNISIFEAREDLARKVNGKIVKDSVYSIAAQNSFKKEMAISIIGRNPAVYFRNYVKAVFMMLLKPIRSDLDVMLNFRSEPSTLGSGHSVYNGSLVSEFFRKTSITTIALCFFQMLLLAVMYILSFRGVYALYSRQLPKIKIFVPIIIYFYIMSAVSVEVYARFRVPIIPFLAILAGVGVLSLKKDTREEIN